MLTLAAKASAWDLSECEMTSAQRAYIKEAKARDELHVGLDIPKQAATEVFNWVQEQDWPEGTELEPLEDYHITLLFAQGAGAGAHHDAKWITHDSHAVSIKGIKEFPSSEEKDGLHPVVLLVESDMIKDHHNRLAEAAEDAGVDPGPYSKEKYAPHMTIAYGPGLPKGLKPPKLTFETSESSVSTPREEKESSVLFSFVLGEPPQVPPKGTEHESKQEPHLWRIAQPRPPYLAELVKFAAHWSEEEDEEPDLDPDFDDVMDQPAWGDEGLAMRRPVHGPLYHIAPTEDRARIQTHGLMAASPGVNPRYDTLKGNGMPNFKTQPHGVYVTKEVKGTGIGFDRDRPTDVWEVNPQHVRQLLTDPHSPNYWSVIPHDVPPEALTMHAPADPGLWELQDPPRWNRADEETYVKGLDKQKMKEWGIGRPDRVIGKTGAGAGSDRSQESWTPKSQWPNALRERNGEPVDADCTCKDGHKLDCPVHGMYPVLPTYDDTLDFPNPANPVGYDYHGDGPRTWMRAETKTAANEPWYHITDNPNFAFDPKHTLNWNSTMGNMGNEPPGMFLTKNPEYWFNGHDYVRPYIAEIHAPEESLDPGYYEHNDRVLPAHAYPQAQIKRVLPIDEYVREQYGEPGWIEGYHDHEGVPYHEQPKYPDYHYEGPDVRDMTPEEHQRHADRTRGYIKGVRPHMLDEWDENGERVPFKRSSAFQLAWLPGSNLPGKGLVTPSGDIHTWPVDKHGAPDHAEYMDSHAPYALGEGNAHFFNIRPRGGLDTKTHEVPANLIDHIFRAVPSLRPGMHTDWHFGADKTDTRQYPDARMMPAKDMREPAQQNAHPEAHGCTCQEGEKLTCPVHGLNPDPVQQRYDHSWSVPEGSPVNFPQDQPRNYMKSEGSQIQIMYHVAPRAACESIEHHGLDHTRSLHPNYAEEEGHAVGTWLYDREPWEDVHYLPGQEDVWQVDARGLAPHQMSSSEQDEPGMFMTHDFVEPQRLKRIARAGDGDGYIECAQGHQHWGVNGAAGLMLRHVDDQGQPRYLLTHRSPAVMHGDTYSVPGGALDSHEYPEEGALREAQEELGPIPGFDPTGIETADHGGWAYHTVHGDVPQMFTPRPQNWETSDAQWYTPEEIDQLNLHPGFRAYWESRRHTAAWHFAKETLPQQMRRWQDLRPHPRSGGQIVHSFPDGWTVQKHPTKFSVQAVGQMMRNCWRGKRPILDAEGNAISSGRPGIDAIQHYMALHDENDIPRVAFYVNEFPEKIYEPGKGLLPGPYGAGDKKIRSPWGPRNKRISDSDTERLQSFAQAHGISDRFEVPDELAPEDETFTLARSVYNGGSQDDAKTDSEAKQPSNRRESANGGGEAHENKDVRIDMHRHIVARAHPTWLGQWMARHGPYAYHGSDEDFDAEIARNGLMPWNQIPNYKPGIGQEGELGQPRPGHIYLSATPPYPEDYSRIYKVDLRKLNPENLNPDEDWYSDAPGSPPINSYTGQGAENLGLGDDPAHTHASMEWGKFAHRGRIPPEAISIHGPSVISARLAWDVQDPRSELAPKCPHCGSAHLDHLPNGELYCPDCYWQEGETVTDWTIPEGWSGLPRAEGAVEEEDEHEDDLEGKDVQVPAPPEQVKRKQRQRKDEELVQESLLHLGAWQSFRRSKLAT